MKRIIRYSIVVIGLMILVGGQVVDAKPSGELKIALTTLYDQTMHPIWGIAYRGAYLGPMYDYIVGVDKDGNFSPENGIAHKWEKSADSLKWTFYIRQGVKFHDGSPLTAADVKYTIEQAATKKNRAGRRAEYSAFIDRVDLDQNKVIVTLKKPWITFLYYLSELIGTQGMVQPKKYIEGKGDDYFRKNPIGSGPYKLADWKQGDFIKLVAQDSHWRIKSPKYQYLTFKLIPEQTTRIAALKTGEADIAPISIANVQKAKESGYKIVKKADGLLLDLTFLRTWRKDLPVGNPKVRQALTLAIDREEIVKQMLAGNGQVIGTTIALFPWAFDYKPFPPFRYDPAKAKKLLAEAGYAKGLTMHLYSFVTKLPESKMINEAIAAYWESIGVKTKLLEMDYSAFKPYWIKKKEPPGSACFVMAWPNRVVYSWRGKYFSKKLFSNVEDPVLDKMITAAEAESTIAEYTPKSQEIMKYVLDQAYATSICTTDELFAQGNKSVPNFYIGESIATYRWEYIGTE